MKKAVLMGMPGSGKSRVGKAVAESLGILFYDLDSLFEETYKVHPGNFLRENPEKEFRKRERNLLLEVANKNETLILACGGGTPTYSDNIEYIKESFFTLFLDPPLEVLFERILLEKDKRPWLSEKPDLVSHLEKLADQRRPFYEEASSVIKADNLDSQVMETLSVFSELFKGSN